MPTPDITLDDMRLRARERVDMVGSKFVTDDECDRYAREAWLELQMKLVSRFEDFFLTRVNVSLTAGAALELPADFFKFRGLRFRDGAGEFLRRLDVREIPYATSPNNTSRPSHYFVRGDFSSAAALVELYPSPNSAYSMELFYVPIKSLDDAVAGSLRMIAGFSEYIVLTMAIKMRDKEESDAGVLLAERTLLYDTFEKAMTPLDTGEPAAVVQMSGVRRPGFHDDPFGYEDLIGG